MHFATPRLLAIACLLVLVGCTVTETDDGPSAATSVANPFADGGPVETDAGYLQATYTLDDEPITLKDGRAERRAAQDSVSVERFSVLEGSPVTGDLDGNGTEDVAFVLVEETDGSGTFSYAVAALQDQGQVRGSSALFLGDRIGKPTLAIRDGLIHATFLDRPDGVPFTQPPMRERVIQAKLNGLELDDLGD
ncbi:MAG TPA: hypothetical protein VMS49_08340 [Lysobacter sp.]|jgi:hypothetical protein|nr:hypothetical protein [Lysobacter sp.]